MFVVTVLFRVKAGHEEVFEAAILENAKLSVQDEPGCQQFDVCKGPDGQIFLYEIYDDEAAFKAHTQTPHFVDFDAKSAPWTADKLVGIYNRVGANSAD